MEPLDIGPFRLTRPLGRGGMGEVWEGVHRADDLPVAIKVIAADAAEAAERAAFQHEVRAAARLQHPNIVLLLDYGVLPDAASTWGLEPGAPYLVMERADGNLQGFVGSTPWGQLRSMLLSVLDALAHAHARGVVHCDLKPANVLVGGVRPGVKLADFGLALALRFGSVGARPIGGGTSAYMAPEQFERRHNDFGPWTDLYALGCMAWELVAGAPPFVRPSLSELAVAHLQAEPEPLLARAVVPEGFEGWLRALLRKDVRDRAQRAADAAMALARLPDLPDGADDLPRVPTDAVDSSDTFVLTASWLAWPELASPPPSTPDAAPMAPPPLPAAWVPPSVDATPPRLVGAGLGLFGLRSVPLVDRADERAALWAALGEVHVGRRARAVVLRGPAGCGKSRLADALCAHAHEVGAAQTLRAVHGPIPGPEDGIGPMLRRHLRSDALRPDERSERLQGALTHLGVDDPLARRALIALLSPRDPGASRIAGDSERRGLLTELLARIAAARPLVVWCDDAHWGLDTLELVRSAIAQRRPAPVLFVLTVREDAIGDHEGVGPALAQLEGDPAASTLAVRPLGVEHRRALVDAVLALEPELADDVAERTEGNPLFAVHLLGDWVERDLLEVGSAGFRLRAGAERAIPQDLYVAWSERLVAVLGGCPEGSDVALELAAVGGQEEVDGAWWRAAAAEGLPAQAALQALLASGLAETRRGGGWSFAHGMLRESLVRRADEVGRLARLHRMSADALRDDDRPLVRARLGHHLLMCGAPEEAVAPLVQAADGLRHAGALGRAGAVLTQCAAALDAADLPASDLRRGHYLRERLYWLQPQGDPDLEGRTALELEEQALAHGWPHLLSFALRRRAQRSENAGAADEALALAQRALAAAEAEGAMGEALWSLHRWAHILVGVGRVEEGARACAELRARAEAASADHQLGYAHKLLGKICILREDRVGARDHARAAVACMERYGSRPAWADVVADLADAERGLGELTAAEQHLRAAAEVYARGPDVPAAVLGASLGIVLGAQGRHTEARTALVGSAGVLRGSGFETFAASIYVFLMPSLAALEDWPAFAAALEAAAPAGRSQFADPDVAEAALTGAEAALHGGQRALAREVAQIALGQWRTLGVASGIARAEALVERVSG